MRKTLILAGYIFALVVTSSAFANERTVKLAVENMWCGSCPYIVKQVLTKVPGVNAVVVSSSEKSATVTFDDSKTTIKALTDATFESGYPSELIKNGG